MENVSVVIPALNEEKTIANIVRIAKKTPHVKEVIVVDDCSSDQTVKEAKKAGAKVVQSKILGKGASMRDGLRAATQPVVAFIDADLSNVKSDIVWRLCEPVLAGEADFVKSTFGRKAGRVTELVAKPLLELFFPEATNFTQPLSGMVAGRKKLFDKMEFENDYGVDAGILIDAVMLSPSIEEVDIGFIGHKMKSWRELKPMSLEVSRAIIARATKYRRLNLLSMSGMGRFSGALEETLQEMIPLKRRLAAFDMDGVLLDGRFIFEFAKRHGFLDKIEKISKEKSDTFIKTKKMALLMKDFTVHQIIETADSIPIMPNTKIAIKELKKDCIIGIITDSYSIAAETLRKKLELDFAIGNELEIVNGKATGEVRVPSIFLPPENGCKKHGVCKSNALKKTAEKHGILQKDTIAVGDNTADICMIREAGIGIAFMPKDRELAKAARIVIRKKNLAEMLKYC